MKHYILNHYWPGGEGEPGGTEDPGGDGESNPPTPLPNPTNPPPKDDKG